MYGFINFLRALVGLPPLLRFFWIGEPSEVYVAHSLKQALDAFAQPEDLEEHAYGELNRQRVYAVYDEETGQRRTATLAELGAECEVVPNLIWTQYA